MAALSLPGFGIPPQKRRHLKTIRRNSNGQKNKSLVSDGRFVRRVTINDNMEVTIKVSDQLAAEARALGLSVEFYVQQILAQKTQDSSATTHLESVRAAIDRILELRKGNRLDGLPIKELAKPPNSKAS